MPTSSEGRDETRVDSRQCRLALSISRTLVWNIVEAGGQQKGPCVIDIDGECYVDIERERERERGRGMSNRDRLERGRLAYRWSSTMTMSQKKRTEAPLLADMAISTASLFICRDVECHVRVSKGGRAWRRRWDKDSHLSERESRANAAGRLVETGPDVGWVSTQRAFFSILSATRTDKEIPCPPFCIFTFTIRPNQNEQPERYSIYQFLFTSVFPISFVRKFICSHRRRRKNVI